MALLPVIGDEAYYFFWGDHFSGGYYDLSPMIGWWESLLVHVSHHPFWLRLPNLLAVSLVAFGMYEWLTQAMDRSRARMVALLFFFSPLPFLAVMISPDVPLIFFTFLSAFLFYQSTDSVKNRNLKFFISGALWGAAFLSKYFALLVLPAFGIWFLLQKPRRWSGLALFGLGVLPFLFQHLYWNSQHCWANFVFNLVTRQKAYDGPLIQTFGLYLVYLLVHITPVLWTDVFGNVKVYLESGFKKIAELGKLRVFLWLMWGVPVGLLGLTALMKKGQGLHWYLAFSPFFFMWLGLSFDQEKIRLRLYQMMKLSLVLGVVVGVLLLQPNRLLGWYFKDHYPFDFKVAFHGDQLVQEIWPELKGSPLVLTDNYTLSSVLSYEFHRYGEKNAVEVPEVNLWGDGSRFGRVFDWNIDFKKLEGKRLVIVSKGVFPPRWAGYFNAFHPIHKILQDDHSSIDFYVWEGTEFHAQAYVDQVLKVSVDSYYPNVMPNFWNSLWSAQCPLRDGSFTK